MILIVLAIWGVFGATSILIAKYGSKPKAPIQKTDVKMETKLLLEKIGMLYDLPTGETPTIATVSDKSKLQKQAFFAKAENGDKVLIYTDAKKAILYRPSLNKIMEVASLALTQPSVAPQATTQPQSGEPTKSKSVTVSILNGTKKAGIATATEKKIREEMSNAEVVEKGDAKFDYDKTIVIDITGSNKEFAKKMADVFGGSLASLPSGEKIPKGNILVIIGE